MPWSPKRQINHQEPRQSTQADTHMERSLLPSELYQGLPVTALRGKPHPSKSASPGPRTPLPSSILLQGLLRVPRLGESRQNTKEGIQLYAGSWHPFLERNEWGMRLEEKKKKSVSKIRKQMQGSRGREAAWSANSMQPGTPG